MNPILNPPDNPEAAVHALTTAHRAKVRAAHREILDLRRKQTAAEAVALLTADNELFGLTKAQFSLIDLLDALLDRIGPARLSISTWTAAHADLSRVLQFIDAGRITGARWLVDLTFTRRSPQLAARIRAAFGPESIRVTRNHAKFCLLTNDAWRIVVRTSMNLNFNPRLEDFTVAHDPELATFLDTVLDELWRSQNRALADARPAEVKHWFGETG